MRLNLIVIALLCLSSFAHAAMIEQPLADSDQEAAARTLFQQLKCVVCEGQSLADSDATLALQMRAQIREKLSQGESPQAVETYFRTRYGDRILLAPPWAARTGFLWLAPILIVGLGGCVLWRKTRHEGGVK